MNKNIYRKIVAAALVAGAGTVWAQGSDRPNAWVALSASGFLDTNKTVKVALQEETRFGDRHLNEVHTQGSIAFKVTDWLTFAPRLHQVYSRNDSIEGRGKANKNGKVDHGWDSELRVGADTTLSYDLHGWKFSDRNRVVYRVYEDDEGFWRYRNQIGVDAPWKWTEYKIQPYATWEGFLDDGKPAKHVRKNDKFDAWWGTVGFKARVTDRLGINLFYRLVDKKDTAKHSWDPTHVIGLYANLTF